MIRNLLQVIREWVLGLRNEMVANYGLVQTYDTMPSDSDLLTFADGTRFKTLGYYSKDDGFGGLYVVKKGGCGRLLDPIPENGTIVDVLTNNNKKSLLALDTDGKFNLDIDVCRYGIRSSAKTLSSAENPAIDVDNTYARENSRLIERLILSINFGKMLHFPSGKFFFENPINLSPKINIPNGTDSQGNPKYYDYACKNTSIVGKCMPQPLLDSVVLDSGVYGGTILVFPFLQNGDVAITSGAGNIENICIAGNPRTYTFNIDRTKTGVDPDNIVTETIAMDGDTPIKCTGLKHVGSFGNIKNVNATYFHNGIVAGGNVYLNNIYIKKCHTGLTTSNDTQMRGIYGWNVHTLLKLNGSIQTVVDVRVDSCVNAVNMASGSSNVIFGVDGDYCAGAVILIGDPNGGETWTSVRNCRLYGIHGRHGGRKVWTSGQDVTVPSRDIRVVSGNKEDYPIVYVTNKTEFRNNIIDITTSGGGNIIDGSSTYKTPEIVFAVAPTNNIGKNCFILNDELTTEDILRKFDSRGDFFTEIQTINGRFTKKGNTNVYSSLKDNDVFRTTLPTDTPSLVNKQFVYLGNQANFFKGCVYECVPSVATPDTSDDPKTKKWFELVDGTYKLTTDTTVDQDKTYYTCIWKQLTASVDQLPQ